jgi:hypothetical protein
LELDLAEGLARLGEVRHDATVRHDHVDPERLSVSMFDRVKVKDGKVVEHWGITNDLAMLTQLGVIPEVG